MRMFILRNIVAVCRARENELSGKEDPGNREDKKNRTFLPTSFHFSLFFARQSITRKCLNRTKDITKLSTFIRTSKNLFRLSRCSKFFWQFQAQNVILFLLAVFSLGILTQLKSSFSFLFILFNLKLEVLVIWNNNFLENEDCTNCITYNIIHFVGACHIMWFFSCSYSKFSEKFQIKLYIILNLFSFCSYF